MKRTSLLGRTGEAAAWAISAVAWALSFTAQMQLAGAHGFTTWEVWAWPATTDLAGLTGMLIALDQARRNGSTVVAWLIAVAAAAVMVAANIGAAVGDPVAMMLHAWPPSIALASWFLLVHVRRAPKQTQTDDTEEHIETTTPAPIPVDISEPVVALPVSSNGRVRKRTSARAARRTSGDRVRALLTRHGDELTPDIVSRRLKVSRRHAGRLLAAARQSRVVEEVYQS